MNRNTFMEIHADPFYIDEVYVEDIESLYHHYKKLMLQTTSLAEMKLVREKFKFLVWGATKGVEDVGIPHERILEIFQQGQEAKLSEEELECGLAHIILPKIMLHAFQIAQQYEMPEFYAAVQYVSANCED